MKQEEIADQMEGRTVKNVTVSSFPSDVTVTFEDGSTVTFTVNEPSVWMSGAFFDDE